MLTLIGRRIRQISPLLMILSLMAVLVGCNRLDSPVASQPSVEESTAPWNPTPGERIIPDHDVPLLNPGYWGGMSVNDRNDRSVQTIGRNGGVLRLGNHMLRIPPDALTEDVTITMTYCSDLAVGVDLQPSGLQFNEPVQLTLSFLNTQFMVSPPLTLCIVYLEPTARGYQFDLLPSELDLHGMCVRTDLNHFSRYIIG